MPTKRKKSTPGNSLRTQRRRPSHAGSSRFSSRASNYRKASRSSGFSTSRSKRSSFAEQGTTIGSHHSVPAGDKRFSPEVVLTRRNLLIGAGALGGVALLGGVGSMAIDAIEGPENDFTTLEVPESAVTNIDALTSVAWSDYVTLTGNFELPYNTLVWADNNTVAACLSPGETSSPLNTVSLLFLSTGNNPTVLSEAQGAEEHFEIFDVRASENGLVWVESNVLENRWRVYTAQLNGSEVSNILLVDEADGAWLTPSIAAVEDSAFWQVVPNGTGPVANESSVVKAAHFGSQDVAVPYSSRRAFATRITPATDGVVITPRAQTTGTYYQLTKLSANDYSTVDQLTLPSLMTPYEAGYGRSGFTFAFEGIYNYGGGIANMGTYAPLSAVNPYNYQGLSWMHYGRTPSSTPAWCGEWFVVKSTRSLCAIHFATKNYFAIDIPSATDDYGEYLVSSGTSNHIVGLSQINDIANPDANHALVRVFSPIEGSITPAFG